MECEFHENLTKSFYVFESLIASFPLPADKLSELPEPADKGKPAEGHEKKDENPIEKEDKPETKTTEKVAMKGTEKPTEGLQEKNAKPSEKTSTGEVAKNAKKTCASHPAIKEKSLKGGKKAGKFRYFKNIKDMKTCTTKCCSLDKNCDVAYMEDGKCYTIKCFKKGLCMSADKQPSDPTTAFAYMDHFVSKAEESDDVQSDQGIGNETFCTSANAFISCCLSAYGNTKDYADYFGTSTSLAMTLAPIVMGSHS